jgi:hypothetical protein
MLAVAVEEGQMAICRLIREAAFEQADINQMTAAYEAALEALRLVDRDDPVTELIAKKIIDIVRSGEHDPPRICARAIKELGVPLPE